MHGVGITRDQRMPPIEIAALGDQFVAAARRQPVQGADVFGRQPDAVRNLGRTIRVVLAGAGARIEQFAGDMGEIDLAGILILELFQAARAQPSHKLSHSALDISSNVLVFQKNPSWPETGLGGAVMKSEWFPKGSARGSSRRCGARHASGAAWRPTKAVGGVSPDHQNGEPDHWFMAPARIEQPRVPQGLLKGPPSRPQKRLGYAATSKQDVSIALRVGA